MTVTTRHMMIEWTYLWKGDEEDCDIYTGAPGGWHEWRCSCGETGSIDGFLIRDPMPELADDESRPAHDWWVL